MDEKGKSYFWPSLKMVHCHQDLILKQIIKMESNQFPANMGKCSVSAMYRTISVAVEAIQFFQ